MTKTQTYEYATAPTTETVHLTRQVPFPTKTICGRPVGAGWDLGDETQSGTVATCGRCRRIARTGRPRTADQHGNVVRSEGCDFCYCGCKYWEYDRCIDCGGTEVNPEP